MLDSLMCVRVCGWISIIVEKIRPISMMCDC